MIVSVYKHESCLWFSQKGLMLGAWADYETPGKGPKTSSIHYMSRKKGLQSVKHLYVVVSQMYCRLVFWSFCSYFESFCERFVYLAVLFGS